MAEIDERLLDVDRHGCVRVPGSLWAAIVFLSRHWLMLVFIVVASRRSPSAGALLGLVSGWVLLIEFPALALAWAGMNRSPKGGVVAKWIWNRGLWILALTAVVNICIAVWVLWHARYWHPWPHWFIMSCALIDVAIILGVWQSALIRQVFADFPALEGSPKATDAPAS